MNWISNYVRPKIRALVKKSEVPDNLWEKCPDCGQMIFHRELESSLRVCPHCDYHMRLGAKARLAMLFDDGKYGRATLPAIAPWDFKWSSPEGPESPAMADVDYLMNKHRALELALHNETLGRDFYRQVADASKNADVQCMARDMAAEEDLHVKMLREWLTGETDGSQPPLEDLDPPNQPE